MHPRTLLSTAVKSATAIGAAGWRRPAAELTFLFLIIQSPVIPRGYEGLPYRAAPAWSINRFEMRLHSRRRG